MESSTVNVAAARADRMTGPLSGFRVIDAGMWGFGPIATAVLADWGADVIKVEHVKGDPFRSYTPGQINSDWHQLNRNKRGVAIDLGTAEGRRVVHRIVAGCDVFLTTFLPPSRKRLGVDLEDVRATNPEIVYVRASAYGPRGPESGKGGYDPTAFWARSGAADSAIGANDPFPPAPPAGALFGDYSGGHMLAAGVLAALLKRERTGETSVVDGSLYGCGIWALGWSVVGEAVGSRRTRIDQTQAAHLGSANAMNNRYRTQDGRFLWFQVHESDRGGNAGWWADVCRHVGREDLIADSRFASPQLRRANSRELVGVFDEIFGSRPFAEWADRLRTLAAPWSPVSTIAEVLEDPQAIENGYLQRVTTAQGDEITLVASPIQLDETSPPLAAAPEHGEHTDEILAEAGLSQEEIGRLRAAGTVA